MLTGILIALNVVVLIVLVAALVSLKSDVETLIDESLLNEKARFAQSERLNTFYNILRETATDVHAQVAALAERINDMDVGTGAAMEEDFSYRSNLEQRINDAFVRVEDEVDGIYERLDSVEDSLEVVIEQQHA